jgi:hypothetical protein
MARSWLENVREHRNVLERACMLAEDRVLDVRELEAAMPPQDRADGGHSRSREATSRTLTEDLHVVEPSTSCGCLRRSGGTSARRPRASGSVGARSTVDWSAITSQTRVTTPDDFTCRCLFDRTCAAHGWGGAQPGGGARSKGLFGADLKDPRLV